MAARARTLDALVSRVDFPEALDAEQACFLSAACNSGGGNGYSRAVYRILYALDRGRSFPDLLRRHGGLSALAASESPHFFPCQRSCTLDGRTTEETEEAKTLLDTLSANDISLGDGGVRCAKCKSTEISFQWLQTRSADEGTSCFASCDKCGKRWKL
jgi:DNA-directed RNA polymerase subunit M/transcription elongation factor TFIIS